jgi:EF-P beta-lysylation protein EpmB
MSSSRKLPIAATESGRLSAADRARSSCSQTGDRPDTSAVAPEIRAPIIHESGESWQAPDWRKALSESFTNLNALLDFLELDPRQLAATEPAATGFSLRVPRGFAAQMRKGDPDDPLLQQVLPSARELLATPGFGPDPVGDLRSRTVPGVLHKYRGRVLLMATGACAVHCRYCFRRHYPYAAGIASAHRWRAILDYLRADGSIREVILSGGDPLLVGDARLAEWFEQLAGIGHLERLRLHTRLPVVLPQRVTPALLELLRGAALKPVVVLHINHPNELAEPVLKAIAGLKRTDALLLNQSVLLRRINDSAEILAALSERLFSAGVLPYYLHQLDRVQGGAHFEVDAASTRDLYQKLLAMLPGYLVPRLVQEIAGRASKIPITG